MSESQSMPPWLYFLSGSLLPTIAYLVLNRRTKDDAEDEYEYEDDEYESDEDYAETVAKHSSESAKDWGMKDAPYKMLLIVNQELKMGKGKIAAQCGHASVGCYKRSLKMCPSGVRAWDMTGCAKIAVKCPTEEEMRTIFDKALAKGLPMYLVEDAGRTQIAAGSRTVLGILGPTYVFDDITSHLKLM
mmetsp:Transcript_9765/g.20258  ORF Transcript_9765/g.20258 Transcript_9765/m.20258 type:complete len:188 (+) Transcript_9765:106-669(+)